MTPEVVSFGCRLNLVEGEAIRRAAAAHGDLTVVNTCGVTNEAVRQARQAIRRLRREAPGRRIVVTGCAAEMEPARFAMMPEVDGLVANRLKTSADTWAEGAALPSPACGRRWPDEVGSDEGSARLLDFSRPSGTTPHPTPLRGATFSREREKGHASPLEEGTEGTRAFLAVQNGCDHACTFCAIPRGRGAARSALLADVVARARSLTARGFREIVLTGVDLTSWGGDLPGAPRLGRLVRAILAGVPGLPRLRLSSIDCIEADADLLAAFAEEERLMPYLHLSLQSGDDMILKRMRRRHARAEAVALCAELRRLRPDMAFGADLIAGFPTETEDMAASTRALVEDCGLAFLHIFPFSARPDTPAARMPQVAAGVARARAARLREVGDRALRRHLAAQVGRRLPVLAERGGIGRAPDFTPVAVEGLAPGEIGRVLILGHDDLRLRGLLDEAGSAETPPRDPSPAWDRRWPDEVGSDEGGTGSATKVDVERRSQRPHPTPLRGATFSRKREKEPRGAMSTSQDTL